MELRPGRGRTAVRLRYEIEGTTVRAPIAELLARLDADGKLNETQKGWQESSVTLRNGSQ